MATAADIITRALRGIGAIDAIETPSAEDMSAGLLALNELLEAYSLKRGAIYAQVTESVTLTVGDGQYSMGTGADLNTVRPLRIESAFLRDGSTDYPLEVIASRDQWNAIGNKAVTARPSQLFYDATFANGTVLFDTLPDKAYTLTLSSWKPFSTFDSAYATVALPGYFNRYWRLCLMMDLAPEYGRPVDPLWLVQKDELEAYMRTLHRRDVKAAFDMTGGRPFDINGD